MRRRHRVRAIHGRWVLVSLAAGLLTCVGLAPAAAATALRAPTGAAPLIESGVSLGAPCRLSGGLAAGFRGLSIPAGVDTVYANLWVDWNGDGDYSDQPGDGGICAPEWTVENVPIPLPQSFAGSAGSLLARVGFVTGGPLRKVRYRVTVSDTPKPDAGGMPSPFGGDFEGTQDGEVGTGPAPVGINQPVPPIPTGPKNPPPKGKPKPNDRPRIVDAGCDPATLVLDHGMSGTFSIWVETKGRLKNGRLPWVYARFVEGPRLPLSMKLGRRVVPGWRVWQSFTVRTTQDPPKREEFGDYVIQFSLGSTWRGSVVGECRVFIYHDEDPFDVPPLPKVPCGGIHVCGGAPRIEPPPLPPPGLDLGSWSRQMFEGREVVAVNLGSSISLGLPRPVEGVLVPLGRYREEPRSPMAAASFFDIYNPYALSPDDGMQYPLRRVPLAAADCEILSGGGSGVLDCAVVPQPAGAALGVQLVLDARGFEQLVADPCPALLSVGVRLQGTPPGAADYRATVPRAGCP
jgi:hypothetical protein